MKFYKNQNNDIFAHEDNHIVTDGNLVEITATQKDEILAAAQTAMLNDPQVINDGIFAKLNQIDIKSIRALRENDTARLATLEQKAATLRSSIVVI